MKKLLLIASLTFLHPLSATAQINQSLYAKPLVNQVVNQPKIKDLYEDIFNLSDVNDDMFISENEFSHIVEAVDTETNLTDQEKTDKKAHLLKTFAEVDTNKDNKLAADEFYNFMVAETQFEAQKRLNTISENLNSPTSDAEIQERMDQTIKQLDEIMDNLQKTSPQDMAELFIANISNSIADENYFQMDQDKNGCATQDEFVNYMLIYQKNQHQKSPDIFKNEDLMSSEELTDWYRNINKQTENCLTKEEYVKDITDLSFSDSYKE